jgi:hypothetical protein
MNILEKWSGQGINGGLDGGEAGKQGLKKISRTELPAGKFRPGKKEVVPIRLIHGLTTATADYCRLLPYHL